MLSLFGVLVLFTSLNTWVRAKKLNDNALNRRQLLEQQQIPRGLILARNGTRLAVNRRQGSGETKRYSAAYPQAPFSRTPSANESTSIATPGPGTPPTPHPQARENGF